MQVTKGTWCMRKQCVPGSLSFSPAQEPGNEAISCPAHVRLRVRNGLVNKVELIPKSGNDQWDCEISNIMQHFPYNSKICSEYVFLFLSGLLGDIVAKCTSPRNLTQFTKSFLLVRRWGLGTKLIQRAGGWRICKAHLGHQRWRYKWGYAKT